MRDSNTRCSGEKRALFLLLHHYHDAIVGLDFNYILCLIEIIRQSSREDLVKAYMSMSAKVSCNRLLG